ncbi:hypothetical protein CFU_2052 [Collimonas fungivorans Ter331]|uniref:Uncharacterized protein n=2 Tax=Collimonas fungivorans TaxID=158899 RepID=G0ABS6_COLFT|nr:hypothetical protein CFU_2052 [Collimonas fungivorans Ter331]
MGSASCCTGKSMPTTAIHPEFHLRLFSQAAADDIVQRLLNLDAFWLPRHPQLPFYTLGATNYYDITGNPAKPYLRLARQYNPFLLENFSDVYRALLAGLQEQLGQPVDFLADAALPGFHIFGGHADFTARDEHDVLHGEWFQRRDGHGFPGNPIHVDTAHLALGLPAAVAGVPLPTLSFTLALCLPEEGAGMKIWPLRLANIADLGGQQQMQLLQDCASRLVAYQAGGLFVHSGDYYHQARGLPVQDGQYRITLQGHGAWLDGQWRLFW